MSRRPRGRRLWRALLRVLRTFVLLGAALGPNAPPPPPPAPPKTEQVDRDGDVRVDE